MLTTRNVAVVVVCLCFVIIFWLSLGEEAPSSSSPSSPSSSSPNKNPRHVWRPDSELKKEDQAIKNSIDKYNKRTKNYNNYNYNNKVSDNKVSYIEISNNNANNNANHNSKDNDKASAEQLCQGNPNAFEGSDRAVPVPSQPLWNDDAHLFEPDSVDKDELKFTPQTFELLEKQRRRQRAATGGGGGNNDDGGEEEEKSEGNLETNSKNGSNNKKDKKSGNDEEIDVAKVAASLRARNCSVRRFLFVNTHTWGRHHNQFQEMLHTIAFARLLGRTAVFGFFRAQHKWWDVAEFYDMSLLLRDECVVTFWQFRFLWKMCQGKLQWKEQQQQAVCLGQGTKSTPFSKIVRNCKLDPSVPSHFTTKTGFITTRNIFFKMLFQKPAVAQAHFLGISGEIAFFLRPGMREMARLMSRVRPSKPVAAELLKVFAPPSISAPSATYRMNLRPNARMASFWKLNSVLVDGDNGGGANYFSLHLRHRERDCLKEVDEAIEINSDMFEKMSKSQKAAIRTQCALNEAFVETQLLKPYGWSFDDDGGGGSRRKQEIFLASDHQNVALEEWLVKRGAVMYKGKFSHGTLLGLAVDFFVLAAGARFSGNQLSSISQNVCFMRLGHGLGCQGFVLPYAQHLTAPISNLNS